MKKIILLLVACFFSIGIYAQNDTLVKQDVIFPEPAGYITDVENILTTSQRFVLKVIIEEFTATGKGQIAVATIKDITPYDDFDMYALDLTKHWGVGHKGKDDGLTIILSANLRKVRISTGTGTEKILSDLFCTNIIQNFMVPHFKKGEYFEGLKEALETIISEWKKH